MAEIISGSRVGKLDVLVRLLVDGVLHELLPNQGLCLLLLHKLSELVVVDFVGVDFHHDAQHHLARLLAGVDQKIEIENLGRLQIFLDGDEGAQIQEQLRVVSFALAEVVEQLVLNTSPHPGSKHVHRKPTRNHKHSSINNEEVPASQVVAQEVVVFGRRRVQPLFVVVPKGAVAD